MIKSVIFRELFDFLSVVDAGFIHSKMDGDAYRLTRR